VNESFLADRSVHYFEPYSAELGRKTQEPSEVMGFTKTRKNDVRSYPSLFKLTQHWLGVDGSVNHKGE
jgi:hypothetical protein